MKCGRQERTLSQPDLPPSNSGPPGAALWNPGNKKMKGTLRYQVSLLIHAGSILLISVLAGAAVWAAFDIIMEIGKLIGG